MRTTSGGGRSWGFLSRLINSISLFPCSCLFHPREWFFSDCFFQIIEYNKFSSFVYPHPQFPRSRTIYCVTLRLAWWPCLGQSQHLRRRLNCSVCGPCWHNSNPSGYHPVPWPHATVSTSSLPVSWASSPFRRHPHPTMPTCTFPFGSLACLPSKMWVQYYPSSEYMSFIWNLSVEGAIIIDCWIAVLFLIPPPPFGMRRCRSD